MLIMRFIVHGVTRKGTNCAAGKYKKQGHFEKPYCFNCKIDIKHVECVEFSCYDSEMFRKEF